MSYTLRRWMPASIHNGRSGVTKEWLFNRHLLEAIQAMGYTTSIIITVWLAWEHHATKMDTQNSHAMALSDFLEEL